MIHSHAVLIACGIFGGVVGAQALLLALLKRVQRRICADDEAHWKTKERDYHMEQMKKAARKGRSPL
jgi:hypothetical protein